MTQKFIRSKKGSKSTVPKPIPKSDVLRKKQLLAFTENSYSPTDSFRLNNPEKTKIAFTEKQYGAAWFVEGDKTDASCILRFTVSYIPKGSNKRIEYEDAVVVANDKDSSIRTYTLIRNSPGVLFGIFKDRVNEKKGSFKEGSFRVKKIDVIRFDNTYNCTTFVRTAQKKMGYRPVNGNVGQDLFKSKQLGMFKIYSRKNFPKVRTNPGDVIVFLKPIKNVKAYEKKTGDKAIIYNGKPYVAAHVVISSGGNKTYEAKVSTHEIKVGNISDSKYSRVAIIPRTFFNKKPFGSR